VSSGPPTATDEAAIRDTMDETANNSTGFSEEGTALVTKKPAGMIAPFAAKPSIGNQVMRRKLRVSNTPTYDSLVKNHIMSSRNKR